MSNTGSCSSSIGCRPPEFLPGSNRGSVLAVAVILAGVMTLAVASFLKLANFESRLALRMFHSNGSLNLAEAGIERGLFAINNDNWTGWDQSGSEATMDAEEIDLGGNTFGTIRARVTGIGGVPVIRAEGTTRLADGSEVVKQVEVSLSRRSLFANGITARRNITFNGNVDIDSYESSRGPPSSSNRKDNGSVASTSVEINAISLSGNSEIWGRVATGGSWPKLSGNAKIHGSDTTEYVRGSGNSRFDPNRVALDFASDFPEVSPPDHYDQYIPEISLSGNTKDATLGTPDTVTKIKMESLSVSGNSRLTIIGPVVVELTGDLYIGGNAEIVIADSGDASAEFYILGNLRNGGNGTFNESQEPKRLQIYGTNSVYQHFDLGGNVDLQAAIYAPNAFVDIGGNAEISGAIVADKVEAGGNFDFHYDEDLSSVGGSTHFGMDRWRELYLASDRMSFH